MTRATARLPDFRGKRVSNGAPIGADAERLGRSSSRLGNVEHLAPSSTFVNVESEIQVEKPAKMATRSAGTLSDCFSENPETQGDTRMTRNERRIVVAIMGTISMSMSGLLAPAADSPVDKDLRGRVAVFMRAKLASSQSVLEGLVTEKFDLVVSGGQRMIVMSRAAEWNAGEGDVYRRDTARFVDAAEELIKHAKAKNIEGATLSYLQLTMSCVDCHKHVRATRLAAGGRIPPGLRDREPISTAKIARMLSAR